MFLSTFKTYWAANATLTAALPITSIFLDIVPPGTAFPYGRLTIISDNNQYLTGGPHIGTVSYQLSVFHTNPDTAETAIDTIMAQLDQAVFTSTSMMNTRTNHLLTAEILDGTFTYHALVEYQWTFNTTADG